MTIRRGRPMDRRLRVRGWLRTETPLHVGGAALNPAEALPVAVDGQDRIYVPGSSLAGALRNWMRGADPNTEHLDSLWGYAEDGVPDSGHASRVVVHDAFITTTTAVGVGGAPADPLPSGGLPVRFGVGIDRVTGAAAPAFLYARTVVPPGHYLSLELDVETAETGFDRERDRLGVLLEALRSHRIALGAATSTGLGRVSLLPSPFAIYEHDFTSPDGLMSFLLGEQTQFDESRMRPDEAVLPDRRELLTVTLRWRPAAPVMVQAAGEGAAIKALPLTTAVTGEDVALVLSGSSIKGVLRGHAEFVERTARGVDAPIPPLGEADRTTIAASTRTFLAQLNELPAVRALFGAARIDHDSEQRHPWGNGALTAHECVSLTPVPGNIWKVLADGLSDRDTGGQTVLPAHMRAVLAELGIEQADHVAIDRWTGSAADSLLFSVLEPHGVQWEPIRLTVDLTRLGRYRRPALALLLLILRDLDQGRIPLGGMVNRGFGDVSIEKIEFAGNGWDGGTSLAAALATPALAEAWSAYLEEPP